MKRKLTTLLAITVMLIACTKSSRNEEAAQANSTAAIKEKIAGAGFAARVQLFNMLNTQEKFNLWHAHLLQARNEYAVNGNTNALVKIDELLANLTPEVFEADSKASTVFSNYFMPQWNVSAQKFFSPEELYNICFDPAADIMKLVAPDDVGGGGGQASCFCHVGASGFSCRKIQVGIPSGVTIVNGICERSGECKGAGTGCGWFWLQSCYGDHCNF